MSENIQVNLHTHTVRCHHASGTEREFIETAIGAGIKTLGFSDHSPYFFEGDYYSDYRMRPEEADGYFDILLALREEYRSDIEIKIGFETEYYPKFFGKLLDFYKSYPLDYLILGQHFLGNEMERKYSGAQTADPDYLAGYVDSVCEGIRTGCYTYVAHPELCNFVGDDEVYEREYSRLIRAAMAHSLPLEINMLGIGGKRHYPNEKFWRLCGELGADVCIGCDAHYPQMLDLPDIYAAALDIVKRCSLNLITDPKTVKPF